MAPCFLRAIGSTACVWRFLKRSTCTAGVQCHHRHICRPGVRRDGLPDVRVVRYLTLAHAFFWSSLRYVVCVYLRAHSPPAVDFWAGVYFFTESGCACRTFIATPNWENVRPRDVCRTYLAGEAVRDALLYALFFVGRQLREPTVPTRNQARARGRATYNTQKVNWFS